MMKGMKITMKSIIKKLSQLFIFGILCFCLCVIGKTKAYASNAGIVEVTYIDYEEAYILIQPHNNTKVYYSDVKETAWNEVEGKKTPTGLLMLDISWISTSSDYELHLKGDDNETIVELILPKQNKAFSATFDKLDGRLIIDNENGASYFEWRKSTSYEWNQYVPVSQYGSAGESFLQAVEEMRVKGGKIYVRIPQTTGTGINNVGKRASREVLVTITKRANAPTVKINNTKLTLSTMVKHEYKIYSIGGVLTGNTKWLDADKMMSVKEVAPSALFATSPNKTQEVVLAIRTKATEKAPYSKTQYLTIPAQEKAPKGYTVSYSDTQYLLYFSQASKTNIYQYVVVKENQIFNEETAAWKSVNGAKTVTLSSKTTPAGSTIYIRMKGNTGTTAVPFSFSTECAALTVKYSK